MKTLLILAALAAGPTPGAVWSDADCYGYIKATEDGVLVHGTSESDGESPVNPDEVKIIDRAHIVYGLKLYSDPAVEEAVCD